MAGPKLAAEELRSCWLCCFAQSDLRSFCPHPVGREREDREDIDLSKVILIHHLKKQGKRSHSGGPGLLINLDMFVSTPFDCSWGETRFLGTMPLVLAKYPLAVQFPAHLPMVT